MPLNNSYLSYVYNMTAKQVQLEEELGVVQQAIIDIIEGGESVTIGDMSYTEVSLDSLYKRESMLERKISRLDGSKPVMVGVNFTNFRR